MTDARWEPLAGRDVAVARARMLEYARQFFSTRQVLEVDTPILSRYAITEPAIDSIEAASSLAPRLYLQTSPEYRMKRLIAAGFGDIYQVCKVFRDSERGARHLPEFTMIEWYRLSFGLRDMIRETVDFIAALLDRPEWAANVELVAYDAAFASALQIDLATATIDSLSSAADADTALRQSLGDDRDAWLDLLLAGQVVSHFPDDRLTVLYHYPASQAALARLCPDDSTIADRFEVFLGPLELANGFVELGDAGEQLERFENDREIRRRQGKRDHAIDPGFIAALQSGLPPCAGVAVGFDRLLMISRGASDIAAVTHFEH